MRANGHLRKAILERLRLPARTLAYAVGMLLSLVWLTSAMAALSRPLLDLGRARIGDMIIALAHLFELDGPGTFQLDLMLIGLRLMLGAYLVLAVLVAVYQRLRRRPDGDDMLDLGLLFSAVASIVAAAPVVVDGHGLRIFVGELMLCVIAAGLLAFADGTTSEAEIAIPEIAPMPAPQEPPLAA